MKSRGRRAQRARHGRGRRGPGAESLQDQPVPEPAGNVRCPVCGYPVDPKRMHFHMVRFHGAAMRSGTA